MNEAIFDHQIKAMFPCFQPVTTELLAESNMMQGGSGKKRKQSLAKMYTKDQLYDMAVERGIKGRSKMNKMELVDALCSARRKNARV
jgi:hypothetical protein